METRVDAWQNVAVDSAGRAAIWTLIGIAVAFKVVTSIVIFMMQPSAPSAAFLIGMHWLWFVAPFVILGLPSLFWFRLMRVRAKRRQLILEEWRAQPELDWTPAATHGRMKGP